MDSLEFLEIVLNNLYVYIVILILTVVVYYCVFKSYFISLFDPFFLNQIFSVFATSVVLFLWIIGSIENKYGIQFALTQIAYWVGFCSYNINDIKAHINSDVSDLQIKSHIVSKQTKYILVYIFVLFILLQLFSYIKFGVPILQQSRLALYEGSGGFGVVGRLIDTLKIFAMVGGFYLRGVSRPNSLYRVIANLSILFGILTYILSGSKSTILGLFSLYFFYLLMYYPSKLKTIRKYEIVGGVIALGIALGVIFVQDSTESSIILFIRRMIGSGDVFYMGYSSDVISQIHAEPSMLFSDILGTYRIVPREEIPRQIGLQLTTIMTNLELPMGPNARHNYLGLLCLGYGWSVLFSYILGRFYSYVRGKMYSKFYHKHILMVLFYITLLTAVSTFETDFTLFVSTMNSFFISSVILLLLLFSIPIFMIAIANGVSKKK